MGRIKDKTRGFLSNVKASVGNTAFGVSLSFSAAKLETILNIIVFTLEQFPAIITAFALRMIIDSCTERESIPLSAVALGICYISALMLSKGIASLSSLLTVSLRKKFEKYLDQRILNRVLSSGISFFYDPANMDSLRIVQNESGVINSVVFVGLRTFSASLALITSIIILSALSPWMTLLYILAVIPAVVANSKFNFLIWQYDFYHSRDYRRSDNIYSEMTAPRKAVEFRLYDNFPHFKKEYSELRNKWISEKDRMFRQHALNFFFGYLIQMAALISVFVLSILRFSASVITAGDVQFYVNTAQNIRNSVMSFFDNVTSIAIYSDKVASLRRFLNVREKARDEDKGFDIPENFVIEFDNVGFIYPGSDTWVLRNCSFAFEKGERIAFAGLNGAGKSTVISCFLAYMRSARGKYL